MTKIEWATRTWNPTVGCSRVSPGCDHCYAAGVAHRAMQDAHRGLTVHDEDGVDWTGEVRLLPDRLVAPLSWPPGQRVFVDSMSDLFHPAIPDDFIAEVFAVMAAAPQHTFQVLTKRPQRMAALLGQDPQRDDGWHVPREAALEARRPADPIEAHRWPLPNVWLGTSVENQTYADLRIPHLLATPAAVRFLSIEPLLWPVDLSRWLHLEWSEIGECWGREMFATLAGDRPLIDWVIVGGESGPGARPMHPDWVRSIRDQCTAAGVPFFFKQWGEWGPLAGSGAREPTPVGFWHDYRPDARSLIHETPDGDQFSAGISSHGEHLVRIGKKAAGRELDGRTWDEYPEVAA